LRHPIELRLLSRPNVIGGDTLYSQTSWTAFQTHKMEEEEVEVGLWVPRYFSLEGNGGSGGSGAARAVGIGSSD
jgi:hypothetical protein